MDKEETKTKKAIPNQVSSFYYEVKVMKKCESCIWATKINERVSLCPFVKCARDKLEPSKE